MRIKKFGGKVFGADLSANERKAMNMEIRFGPRILTKAFRGLLPPEFTYSVRIGFNAVAIKSTTSISGTE